MCNVLRKIIKKDYYPKKIFYVLKKINYLIKNILKINQSDYLLT